MRVLHVDPATEWRGGQAQLEALLRARPQDFWAGAANSPMATRLRPPDVVLHPNADPRNALRVGAGARRLGVTLVAAHSSHAHDASLLAGVPLVVHRRNHRPPGNVWKYGRVRLVVAVSEFVAELCRRAGITRVVVVHDGADGWPRARRPPNVPPVYLVPAALVAHKGHSALIEAFRHVEGVLEFAGDGPLREELQRLAAGLGPRVRFLGHVSDMAAAFARADIVVLPSREEAGGSTLIEAMASGIPVVASAVGGIPELVGDTGVLVPAGNPAAWVEALQRVASLDPEPARRRAATLSVATMVRATERAYAAALGLAPAG